VSGVSKELKKVGKRSQKKKKKKEKKKKRRQGFGGNSKLKKTTNWTENVLARETVSLKWKKEEKGGDY